MADDVRALDDLMARLGVRRDHVKAAAAVVGERLGRLKPNGHVVRRSPLSDLEELELLALGVHAKRQLWENLSAHADVGELLVRADAQLATLQERRRAAAARLGLGGAEEREPA